MTIQAGQEAVIAQVVGNEHLSVVFGSGEVPVLATPQLLAWCEAATVMAIADHLESHETSVGMRVTMDHVRPTTVGHTVSAKAAVEKVDGRRITFAISAVDTTDCEIAFGTVIRVIVDRDRFLSRLEPCD